MPCRATARARLLHSWQRTCSHRSRGKHLAIGIAATRDFLPHEISRAPQIEATAAAVDVGLPKAAVQPRGLASRGGSPQIKKSGEGVGRQNIRRGQYGVGPEHGARENQEAEHCKASLAISSEGALFFRHKGQQLIERQGTRDQVALGEVAPHAGEEG